MKYLSVILALLFSINATAALPLQGKGQSDASFAEINKVTVPANLMTRSSPTTAHLELGNKNLLINPGFEHSTPTTGWTITATGTATCTPSATTVGGIEGQGQYLLITASGGASGGTCSIKQEVTTNTGMQAYVGANFLPEAIGASGTGITTVVYSLVNGSRITSRDISVTGTSTSWDGFFVPEVAGTSIGVEALITVAASTSIDLGIEGAEAKLGEVTLPYEGMIYLGSATYAVTNCQWSTTSTGDFPVDADCIPTTTGSVSAPDTRIPGVKVANAQPGTYLVIGRPGSTVSGAGDVYLTLSDGTTNGPVQFLNNTENRSPAPDTGSFKYTTSADRTWRFKVTSNASSSTIAITGGTSLFTTSFDVYYVPPSSKVYMSQCGANCENVLSALVTDGSSTTVVSEEVPTSGWLSGNCTNPGAGSYVCTFDSGIFTVAPKCWAVTTTASRIMRVESTASTATIGTTSDAGAAADANFNLFCQKNTADYQASRTIVGSFKEVVTAPGITKPKTCYYKFGGASATLTSPTACSTGTCGEVEDTCGTGSPPSFTASGTYLNMTFAAGTWANSTGIHCNCSVWDSATNSPKDCTTYWETGDNNWSTTSSGGYVTNATSASEGGTRANGFISLECTGQAP
jgi:hypothetical protein